MRIVHERARVRVPATSGNLGPGFDCMGMAHDLWDEVEVRVEDFANQDSLASATIGGASAATTGGASASTANEVPAASFPDAPTARVTIHGEGAGSLPTDGTHLVVRALRKGLELAGAPQPDLSLTCWNGIYQGRGLGSSASALVSGLLLARGLIEDPRVLDDEAVLGLATEVEGHPDNAAPAIYGGAVVAWQGESGAHCLPIRLRDGLSTALLIPDTELLTTTARSVLPEQVPHGDAAFNASRTALLVVALESHPEFLLEATQDRLHQGYRASAMQPSADALAFLRGRRIPAVISGAGPSILVLGELDASTRNRMQSSGFSVLAGVPARGAHLV